MIVVDANVLVYAVLPGDHTEAALAALEADPRWVAPRLWRSEVRNVLATAVRTGRLALDGACQAFREAELLVEEAGMEAPIEELLELTRASGASAYDCEYVHLALSLNVSLLTADRKLAERFPAIAQRLGEARPSR